MRTYSIIIVIILLSLNLWLWGQEDEGIGGLKKQTLRLDQGICYQPRNFDYTIGAPLPSISQIRADLRLLRSQGFRDLVTYSSCGSMGKIPELARSEGFDGTLIMGLWNPNSPEELQNAIAQSRHVNLFCVGNEGLGIRYNKEMIEKSMHQLRQATGVPVTTSEPVQQYLEGPHQSWLLENSDLLLPIAHPFWSDITEPKTAVQWILGRHDYLAGISNKLIILKECGFPSGGTEACHEHHQALFFRALGQTNLNFFYFEGFDQPGKRVGRANPEIEAHWGVNRSDGTPKQVIRELQREDSR